MSKYINSFQLTFHEFGMVHLETAVFVIGHLQHLKKKKLILCISTLTVLTKKSKVTKGFRPTSQGSTPQSSIFFQQSTKWKRHFREAMQQDN